MRGHVESSFSCWASVFISAAVFLSTICNFLVSNNTSALYSASISTSSSVTLDVSPAGDGVGVRGESVDVTTNCSAGYNLSVSTSGNNTLYLNGSTGANAISPMSSTYALNNTNNTNTWGLSLSNNPLTAGAFNPLSTTPLTLKTASETATEGNIDDSFNIYYGTKVSNSIPTGLYSMANNSSIIFYLTMDTSCTDSLDITFLPNAGNDTVTNLPTSSDNTFDTTNHTLILSNKVPVRNGYIFKEWNTASNGTGDYYAPGAVIPTGQNGLSGFIDFYAIWVENCATATICYDGNHADAGTMSNQSATNGRDVNLTPSNFSRAGYGFAGWNTKADGTGTNYGPGQTITMPASGGLNLFANWIAPSGTLQTWSGASSMNTGDVIALRDNRDNEVYAVAKLADNNVWIVENFRLVPNTANITDKNTHNPTSAFLSAYSSSSSSVSQCSTDDAACVEQVLFNSNNLNRSLTPAYNVNDNETAWYSYGVMYNWYTATAGNGSSSLASGSVAGDLCPSGWHLPSGGASGEWGVLASAMSGSTAADKAKTLRNYPNNFIYSGDFNPSKGTPDGRGVQGRIWSTTAASVKNAYRMGYNSSSITGTTNSWNKWDNFSIRCIYQGGNTPYVDVTVDFEGSGINSVSFSGQNLTTETATPNNPTVSIVKDANYTITANAAAGYRATSWSTTSAGTLGNSYSDPNTYTVTDDATLTVTGGAMTAHAVTVNLGANVRSVSFSHANYPTQTVVNSNVGTNNNNGEYTGTVNLYQDLEYTLSSSYEDGYGINAWVTSSNGTLGSTILSSTTYSVVGTATLSLTAKEVEELTYVLVYSAGSGTDAPNGETTTSFDPIHSFSITNSTPIYYGYTFTGWSETSDGNGNGTTVDFTSGDTITITTTGTSTTKTLYPVYAANAACPSGKICYYENGADVQNGGRGTMANQTASSNSTAKLIPTNYSRTGYGFAGWTTSANATPYGPNATITTPDLSSTGLSLYAKWVASSGTLQSWTGCNSMITNSVIALTDTRDGNTYAVAKLADGNCWTIENLRLVPSAATITSENTHNPASGFATEAASSSSSNALCNTDDDSSCINQLQYNTNSLDRSLTQSYDTVGNNVAWYSYGVYYNWYTATAGNGVYNTSANADVTGDICPKNWHLPTSTSSGEWAALNTAVNGGVSNADAGLRNYPINLVWSGDYNGSSRTSGYSNGRYWSSTGFDANNAYRMGHQESGSKGSTPSGNYRKWDGFAIRCIKDEIIEYVNITVNLDAHTSSVGFYSATYGTEQAVNNNGNNDGTDTVTVSLVKGAPYTITASFATGYELASWSNGINSTIGSTTTNPTTYTATNASTLSATSQVSPGPAPSMSCSTKVPGANYMQDFASSNGATIIGNMATGDRYYLRDSRDEKPYCVAKLADGNIWMLDNLALDPTDATTAANMSASNTNATAGAVANYLNGGSSTTGWSSTAVANVTSGFNSNITPMVNNASIDTLVTSYGLVAVNGQAKVGMYYNYCAATAGTYCYEDSNGTDVQDTIIDAPEDICPAGWRMPTGGSTGEYNTLYGYYNTTQTATNSASLQYNLSTPLSGYFDDSSANSQGSYGYWWSSTNNASYGNTYILDVDSENIEPATTNYGFDSYLGASMRCLVDSKAFAPIYTITVSLDSHTTGVSFHNAIYGTQSVSTDGGTVTLRKDVSYTITASFATDYKLSSWSTTPTGVLGSTTTSPTTYTITDTATLTITSEVIPTYTINYVNNCYTFSTGCTTSDSADTHIQYITLNSNPSTGVETGTLGDYNLFTQTGYKIKSWNTTAAGDGADYPANSIYRVPSGSIADDGITLYAQWVPVYTLIYNGNGANNNIYGNMINIKHTNVAVGDYLDLFASNYTRPGYGFAGWSLTQTNTTSASDINSAVSAGTLKIYGPNETFSPDGTFSSYADNDNNVTLYAVWVAKETDVTMQTFSPASSPYNTMPNGSVIALEDSRDNDVYMVAKLADGNWWMGENLRLDNNVTLTSSNTNYPTSLKQTWYQGFSWMISATTADHLSPSLPNKRSGGKYANFAYWCQDPIQNCIDQSMLNTWNEFHIADTSTSGYTYNYSPSATNSVATSSYTSPSHTNLAAPIYSYGNLYNWYSATAGNGTYSSSSNVYGSICPTGWSLPYGNNSTSTNGSFAYLDIRLTSPDGSHGNGGDQRTHAASQRWRTFPNNFIFSGSFRGSSFVNRGLSGYYWSRTSHGSSSSTDSLNLDTNRVNLDKYTGNYNKYMGISVRCIAR